MQYAKREWLLFIIGTIMLFGGNTGDLVIPYYVGLFTDRISSKKYEDVYTLCWQLILINLGASLCVFFRGSIFNLLSERVAKGLRRDLYASIMNKDVEFFDSRKTGDLLSRLGSDIAVVQEGLTTNISMLIRSVVFVIASLVIVFIISWELTLVMIASIIPVMVFGVNFGRAMKRMQEIIQDEKAKISNQAEETFSNVRTVKAFATEIEEIARYEKGNQAVYHQGYLKAVWYGFFNFFANFFVFGSMAAIFGVGAKLCSEGKLSIGQITSFLFYLVQILVNFLIVAQVFGSISTIIGASQKIVELLEYEPKIKTTNGEIPEKAESDIKGVISLKDLKFHYPTKKDVQVLKGVSIEIQ